MISDKTVYCARYTCLVCEHRWENETHSTNDNDNYVNCPECGAELQSPDGYDTFRDALIKARDEMKDG